MKPRKQPPRHLVLLVNAAGDVLVHFDSDRDFYPEIATFDRDRIFKLHYVGGFIPDGDGWASSPSSDYRGAVYIEADAWHISTKTVDKPKPRKRPRKTAKILPFVRPAGGGAA